MRRLKLAGAPADSESVGSRMTRNPYFIGTFVEFVIFAAPVGEQGNSAGLRQPAAAQSRFQSGVPK
jgi:hypothetical protein